MKENSLTLGEFEYLRGIQNGRYRTPRQMTPEEFCIKVPQHGEPGSRRLIIISGDSSETTRMHHYQIGAELPLIKDDDLVALVQDGDVKNGQEITFIPVFFKKNTPGIDYRWNDDFWEETGGRWEPNFSRNDLWRNSSKNDKRWKLIRLVMGKCVHLINSGYSSH